MEGLLSQMSPFTTTTVGRTTHFAAFRSLARTANRFSFPIKPQHSPITSSRCYSTAKLRKLHNLGTESETDQENDSFYVMRKGDFVGVYCRFSDFQAHLGSSVYDLPVSVYKGYSLSNETVEYLLSHGLKDAPYISRASDLIEGMFGTLVPCTVFKDPSYIKLTKSNADTSKKRAIGVLGLDNVNTCIVEFDGATKGNPRRAGAGAILQSKDGNVNTCIVEFDGATKGNPRRGGAGAILRSKDGNMICRVREGLGTTTNNAADYSALILGMKYALKKGFTGICMKGDSVVVCMQIDGSMNVRNENLSKLYKEAKELKNKFESFKISTILKCTNRDADAQAHLATDLAAGQVQEDYVD